MIRFISINKKGQNNDSLESLFWPPGFFHPRQGLFNDPTKKQVPTSLPHVAPVIIVPGFVALHLVDVFQLTVLDDKMDFSKISQGCQELIDQYDLIVGQLLKLESVR
jgi:hypothetical protein